MSVVRLSLESAYPRSYSTISKAIDHVFNEQRSPKEMTRLLQENLPSSQILVTDITPIKRPFAETLQERCFIYKPSSIKKQKPIGHNYSFEGIFKNRKMERSFNSRSPGSNRCGQSAFI